MALFLTGFYFSGEAAKRKRPVPQLNEVFAPEKLREDFRVVREAMEKAHPGLYLYTPKEKFEGLFEETAKSFTKPLTRREFYLRVAPVVEMAKCGHTYFDLPPRLLNHLNREAKLFPLPVFFLNQKAYVDLEGGTIPLGAEVVAINGRPMAEIIAQFLPYIRSDGFNQTMKHRMLADGFALHHRLAYEVSNEYKIKYISFGKKETLTAKLTAIPGAKLQKHLVGRHSAKGKFKNFQFRWIEKEIGLLTVNSFDFGLKKKGRQKYRGFLKETFNEINSRTGVKDLIVDLRFNEGGYVGHDAVLFSYLAQVPFRENKSAVAKVVDIPLEKYQDKKEFFKGVEKSIEKSLVKEFKQAPDGFFHLIDEKNKVNQPKKRGFKGNIYILISGWTHSGGTVVCSLALNNDNITFIGQETGGGHEYYTAGNMVLYTLPNTQCQIEVPMILYRNGIPEKAFPKGSGVLPKHRVTQTQTDFISGKDTVMQFALDLIHQSKK
tara:strand:- start:1470 stop:2942 length:1473 start_codon:yes stop_codon:yes gene_type:complete